MMGGQSMGCDFCGHSTPHGCWDAQEAASCGNYAHARNAMKARLTASADVEKIIEARTTPPTRAQIEKSERAQLARLKAKYE
jgi:hypothetical protein